MAAARPNVIAGETVAGEYFAVLGVEPMLGRALTSADDAADAPLVAVIGEQLWSRAYGRAPNAIGKSIRLNNQVFTIVGVAPARFKGRSDAERGLDFDDRVGAAAGARRPRQPRIPGARAARARRLDRAGPSRRHHVAQQLAQAYPATNEKRGVEVSPLCQRSVRTDSAGHLVAVWRRWRSCW